MAFVTALKKTAILVLMGAMMSMSANAIVYKDKSFTVIAHRGASGELPEHTMEAYSRAIEQGADYIEPDLVLTKDLIFIARHDHYLSTTTDVASRPEFAHLRTTKDGRSDWFVEDFTLTQIKQLRAIQPFKDRDQSHNGLYEIPTIDEIMIRVLLHNKQARKDGKSVVGLYPEVKHVDNMAASGADVKAITGVITTLRQTKVPHFIQSFNPDFLSRLNQKLPHPTGAISQLIQLIEKQEDGQPSVLLANLPAYISGVGASKALLLGANGQPIDYISRAHDLGFIVHIWTIRDDQVKKPLTSVQQEIGLIQKMGADGIFTDFPKTAIEYLKKTDVKEGGE